jgi:hypothetical protein
VSVLQLVVGGPSGEQLGMNIPNRTPTGRSTQEMIHHEIMKTYTHFTERLALRHGGAPTILSPPVDDRGIDWVFARDQPCCCRASQVCRITKLGWFDDAQHRELVEEVTKFLQATVEYCIIGLKILNQLVSLTQTSEMLITVMTSAPSRNGEDM